MNDKLSLSRRKLMVGSAMLITGGALTGKIKNALAEGVDSRSPLGSLPPGISGKDYTPVITPNGSTLPYKLIDGVKVFHLIAEEVKHEFAPGLHATCWGYNGSVHGPTIEAVEGDHVRIYVTNKLPEGTTVHWHGVILPNGMDGVSGLTQKAILPGETYLYEFIFKQHGTFLYHPHHDEMTQMGLGLMGMIVVHPREVKQPVPDRDFALLSSEWKIVPGTSRPNPSEMTEFNILTFNGRCFPGTESLVVKQGERVRIRFGNLSAMDHHPIHLHGFSFKVIATEGGDIPETAQWPETTVLVPVGTTRTIEFVADAVGDWPMHCHMTHHIMNQMGHGLPNIIGVDPKELDKKVQKLIPNYMTMGQTGMGDMIMDAPKNSIPMSGVEGLFGTISMGGMFTILKVREGITNYTDPGWYVAPKETVATIASEDAMRRDGIIFKS